MASQQPTRPWFRFQFAARPAPSSATTATPPPPAAATEAPPSQPPSPLIRPTFRPRPQPQPAAAPQTVSASPLPPPPRSPPPPANAVAASPPKPAAPNQTYSFLPSSPQRLPIVPQTLPPIRERDIASSNGNKISEATVATTPPLELSPRTVKPTVVRTPTPQPTTMNYAPPPPSPLVLPPTQQITDLRIPPEVEQKTIVVQNKFPDTETRKLQYANDQHHNKLHKAKKVVNSEEGTPPPPSGIRMITIAGENKGAFMELVLPRYQTTSSPHYLTKKCNIDSSEERGANAKKSSSAASAAPPPPHMRAFANSNVQGINNSIVYNSSNSHNDPGVHLSFSKKLDGGPPGLPQRSKEGPGGENSSLGT